MGLEHGKQFPWQVGDGIVADVETAQLSKLADACWQLFDVVVLEVQDCKVLQVEEGWWGTRKMIVAKQDLELRKPLVILSWVRDFVSGVIRSDEELKLLDFFNVIVMKTKLAEVVKVLPIVESVFENHNECWSLRLFLRSCGR